MILKILLIFTLTLSLSACCVTKTPEENQQTSIRIQTTDIRGNVSVYRVIDEEAQVVCWFFYTYKSGGISCLPLTDTALQD